jgi:hypothetical protein
MTKYGRTYESDNASRIKVRNALGKDIPLGAVIHHVDFNHHNTANSNLVLCHNEKYHNLLHIRTKAFKACGNANWRMCWYCRQYSDISNLEVNIRTGQCTHTDCRHKHLEILKWGYIE